jgi:hypothetical protein
MIILPAQIESIRTRKDKTTAIVIGTNELTPNLAGQLFSLQNSFVYCALKEEEFVSKEKEVMEDLKADFELDKKSNGQRLRNVLYKNYEQDKEGFTTFVKYYDNKMETLITHFKKKLE